MFPLRHRRVNTLLEAAKLIKGQSWDLNRGLVPGPTHVSPVCPLVRKMISDELQQPRLQSELP